MSGFSVSVAGVVVDDAGDVLLIRRRDTGEWQIPGGILEPGEPLEEGVRREVLEETGVSVSVETLSGVYRHVHRDVVALVYRCRPLSGHPTETEESRESKWVSPSDCRKLLAPVFEVRVTDALGESTESRNHDGVSLLT